MSYPFNNQFDASDFMDDSQQQQQLSPVTGGYPQWETIEQQQHQQHQIESPLDTSMDSTTPTGPTPIAFRSINIEMDEMSRNIMPSPVAQIDDTPITLHHPHALHQQLHLQQQHHQQQQFLQQQQQQYHHQQSRHPSLEPFSTHSSRPGSSQLHMVTSPTDLFRPRSTAPHTPNPTTESGPSTSNPSGRRGTSRKTSGPIRSSGRVTRSQHQAPYYRPTPASTTASYLGLEVPPHAGSSSSTSSTPRIPQRAELTQRKQTVRFTAPNLVAPSPIQTRAASRAAASSVMPSPVVPQQSSRTSQFPESSGSAETPRQTDKTPSRPQSSTGQTQAPPQQHTSAHSQSPPQVSSTPQPQPQTQPQPPPPQTQTSSTPAAIRSYLYARRRYPLNITSDMHYSKSSNILHALLELPGIKKQDVQIKLATCYFNHVKFLSVRAESFPVFNIPGAVVVESGTGTGGDGSGGGGGDQQPQPQTQTQTQDTSSGPKPATSSGMNPDLRERRFGLLQRVIQVPSTTKPEDIEASMEDGILSLKIYCGKPYELDDEETILIR